MDTNTAKAAFDFTSKTMMFVYGFLAGAAIATTTIVVVNGVRTRAKVTNKPTINKAETQSEVAQTQAA